MQKKQVYLLAVFFLLFSGFHSIGQQIFQEGYLQGTFRVKVKPEVELMMLKSASSSQTSIGIVEFDNAMSHIRATNLKRVFPYSPEFEDRHRKHELHLWYEIDYSSSEELNSIVQYFDDMSVVQLAERIREKAVLDHKFIPFKGGLKSTNSSDVTDKEFKFNDPYTYQHYHYAPTGTFERYDLAHINLFEAWEKTAGDNSVVVSVHDLGVQFDHPDLADNMWRNEKEINDDDNRDSDYNGYVNDKYGYNFASNTGYISAGNHGTHVAGTIAAVNNNGVGGAGIAGGTGNGDGVRIMSCQIFDGNNQGGIGNSFVYAADNGAVISQNSWGYPTPGNREASVEAGIKYFIDEAGQYEGSPLRGGIVIFASGNADMDDELYPGYMPEVLTVAALHENNKKASYSNYGEWINISAPGGDMTYDGDLTQDEIDTPLHHGIFSTVINNDYGWLEGTSMATPHVSGVAALVVSYLKDKSLTNTELYNILEGSVDDVYGDNPEDHSHYGKLGTGLINALFALDEKINTRPTTIEDLLIKTLSQDLFELEFTTPETGYNRAPEYYEVYYSDAEFSAGDLGTLSFKKVTADKSIEVGEKAIVELNGLASVTEYYVSVVSVDKWGNKSLLSNFVDGITTEGPQARMEVSYTDEHYKGYEYVKHIIDTKSNSIANGQFELYNDGKGILDWKTNIDFSQESIWEPVLPGFGESHVNVEANAVAHAATTFQTVVEYNQVPDTSIYMGYTTASSYYYIGEASPEDPSSSATRYKVSNENGFNLTHVATRLNVELGLEEQILVEIYEGADINSATLRHRQAITTNTLNQTPKHELDAQIYFTQGSYFWVVIHPPTGHKYPLAIAFEAEKGWGKTNSYYSANYGKTWQSLDQVYMEGFAFMVEAMSFLSAGNTYVTLDADKGRVDGESMETVKYSIDASNVINGKYFFNVNTSTNDGDNKLLSYRVQAEIEGHEPVISGTSIIDFGRVIIGQEKTVQAYITNTGLGEFALNRNEKGNSTNEILVNESTSSYKSPGTIDALSSSFYDLTYVPSVSGEFNSYVRFYKSNSHEEFTVKLTGFAVNPPEYELSPGEESFNDVAIGDELNGTFTISNNGDYPLHYYAPKFADKPNDFEDSETNISKFGYFSEESQSTNVEWDEISQTGTQIEGLFAPGVDIKTTHEVELNFGFPFFGETQRKVYISTFCLIAFTDDGSFSTYPMGPNRDTSPSKAFCGMGDPFTYDANIDSKIFYQDFGDKFIVQYQDMPMGSLDEVELKIIQHKLTLQLVLFKNGNMEVRYKETDGFENTTWWSVWAHDLEHEDAIVGNYHDSRRTEIKQGTSIRFVNPGLGLFKSITNPAGILLKGESVDIDYELSTDILNVNSYEEYLPILTNEPANQFITFKANIDVTSGADPNISAGSEKVEFGTLMHLSDVSQTLLIRNDGRAPGEITNIAITGNKADKFVLETTKVFPYQIAPEVIEVFKIKAVTTEVGSHLANVEVTLGDGKVIIIPIRSQIVNAPLISSNKPSVDVTVASGEETNASFTITNNGLANLEYGVRGTLNVRENKSPLKSASQLKDYQYQAVQKKYNDGVTYEWIDIVDTGVKLESMDLTNYDNFWNKVALPWEFNYYGNVVDTMYVGYCGLISFSEQEEAYTRGGIYVPSTDGPDNIMALMFGFIYNDLMNDKKAGIYYKEFDDEVVVTYQSFTDGFGMSTAPSSFQVIIRKDGSFKFQYKYPEGEFSMNSSLSGIGIENIDGTDGINIAHNSTYIDESTAIEFYPFEKQILAPNESATHNFIVDATNLFADDYVETVTVLNNTVANGMFDVPFNITVTGESDVTIPETFEMGDIFQVEEEGWVSNLDDPEDESWVKYLDFTNVGRKDFKIGKIFADYNTDHKMQFYSYYGRMAGLEMWGWNDVTYVVEHGKPVAIPADNKLEVRVAISKTPSELGELSTVITIVDYEAVKDMDMMTWWNLTEDQIAPEYKHTITLSANVIPSPSMILDKTEITDYALDDTYVGMQTLNISNVDGESDLHFSMDIVYEYNFLPLTDSYSSNDPIVLGQSSATNAQIEPANKVKSKSLKSTSEGRVLTQLLSDEVQHTFGWGTDDADVHTVTRLVAPEDGFCFSQLEHYYTYRNTLEGYYTVQVFAGDDEFLKTGLIYSQRVNYSYDTPLYNNQVTKEIVNLDRPVMIQPGETFYIRIMYMAEMISPGALGEIRAEDEEGNLFGSKGVVYREVSELGVDEIGWMIKAIETDQISPQWLSPSVINGTVETGTSLVVDFEMNASQVFNTVNKAKVYINSNDPNNRSARISAEFVKNNGPTYGIDQNFVIEMNENDTVDFVLYASHQGGLEYTLEFAEDYEFVNGNFDGTNMNLQFTPDYFSAGIHRVVIIGEDSKGLVSTYTFIVNINNVNRAPEQVQEFDLMYRYDRNLSYTLDLREYISDPDLEELEYTVTKDNDIINLFYSNNELIIKPQSVGNTELVITAVDPHGARLVTEATVHISTRVGVEDLDAEKISIYPNPVIDNINISSSVIANQELRYRILSVTGESIVNGIVGKTGTSAVIDASGLPTGVYMLELTGENTSITKKFTKK